MVVSFNDFIKELSKKQLILLGEIHGTKEIPHEVKKIIKSLTKYNIKNVFFEIPIEYQNFLDKFIESSKNIDLYNIPFFKETKDGRNSKDYLDLIRYIRNKTKIKIFFVDSLKSINNRDFNIFDNIKQAYYEHVGLSIFITGNVHAYTDIFTVENTKIKTTGYYLKNLFKDKLVSVNFMPLSGVFYNLWLKTIQNKEKVSKITIEKESIGYDFNYFIPRVSPCSFIY